MRRLLIWCLAMVVGCGSTGPSASIAGAYTLRTVNGKPLPYAVPLGELTAETIVLTDAGTLTIATVGRITLTASTSTTYAGNQSGTYLRNGSTLSLRLSGTDIPATLASGTLTLTGSTEIRVYSNTP